MKGRVRKRARFFLLMIKRVGGFARKHLAWLLLGGGMLFLLFAPSCDRVEEAQGFLKSSQYIIGNGILLGLEVDGKPRVAFLTCRHVIEDKMLATGRAFADRAAEENELFFNNSGWGFWYKGFGRIDAGRWQKAPDSDQDFAWIVLTDDELNSFAGASPSFIRIPKDSFDTTSDVLRACDFLAKGFHMGSSVKLSHMFAPVTGSGGAAEKIYWPTYLKIPFSSSMVAIVYGESGHLIGDRATINVSCEDARGIRHGQLDVLTIDVPAHVNISGSPVFASIDGRNYLVGIFVAFSEDGTSSFQSLDRVLPYIRESLLK